MGWDFSTEPELQPELDWIRRYVDEVVIPLELAGEGLDQRQLDRLWKPFKEEVKERGLWAPHLPPEHGGCGKGQLALALIHEILGRSVLAPEIFGCQAPDSGNAELLAAGADAAQRKRWLSRCWPGRFAAPSRSPSRVTAVRTPPVSARAACVMARNG
ncbi:MAG: acyl-CoA dehydrogenase family protein [Gammaproteobacteria bacterium]